MIEKDEKLGEEIELLLEDLKNLGKLNDYRKDILIKIINDVMKDYSS